MRVTLLGTGTLVPRPDRASPGLVVEVGGELVLVDPGPGSVRRLAHLGFDFRKLDLVGITHRHPDHTIDLLHLFFATRYAPGGPRTKPLTIFGPPGLAEFIDTLTRAHAEWMKAETYERPIVEITPGSALERTGYRVGTEEMKHLKTSVGFRFEETGAVVAYTGDTEVCDEAVSLGKDADLFLIECSSHQQYPGHLTPEGVADILNRSRPKRAVLVHIYPDPDEESLARAVRDRCSVPVELGMDGMFLEAPAAP
jgi:ribonuclease BN (tRNA processing enzyme)